MNDQLGLFDAAVDDDATFTRIVGNSWGTSDAGVPWSSSGDVPKNRPVLICGHGNTFDVTASPGMNTWINKIEMPCGCVFGGEWPDAALGEARKEEAVTRVEANASRAWLNEAWLSLRNMCANHSTLTSDNVWLDLFGRNVAEPAEPRAMGPVMRRAVREGLLRPTSTFQPSALPQNHRRPVRVYEVARVGASKNPLHDPLLCDECGHHVHRVPLDRRGKFWGPVNRPCAWRDCACPAEQS